MLADPLELLYRTHLSQTKYAMTAHLPKLRALATGLDTAVEFGVYKGASSVALLLGAQHVLSYDIVETPQARSLAKLVGDRWTYRIEDSRKAVQTPCDLLLVDSLHTYAQVRAELERHAAAVRKYLVFHDTLTFGSVGAKGNTGELSWLPKTGQSVPITHMGIRPAIDELMIQDPTWHIVAHHLDSHGLLVLERR